MTDTQTADQWNAKARDVGRWNREDKRLKEIAAALRAAYEKGVEDSAGKCAEIGKDWQHAGDYHSAGAAEYLANSPAAIRALKGEGR